MRPVRTSSMITRTADLLENPVRPNAWGSATEIPTQWLAPPYKKVMLMTPSGHSITVDDTPGVGGITLQTAEGAKVVLSSTGCQFTNGQGATVQLTGPQVSVNNGALDVT